MNTIAEFTTIGRVGQIKQVGSTLRVSVASSFSRAAFAPAGPPALPRSPPLKRRPSTIRRQQMELPRDDRETGAQHPPIDLKAQQAAPDTIPYSNPRMNATVEDWPNGSKRVTATFSIESDPKHGEHGERGVRVTTGAPKKLTYAAKARIVDGDDGRTYVAGLTRYGFITIMSGDMKFQKETIHQSDPRYAAAKALFS